MKLVYKAEELASQISGQLINCVSAQAQVNQIFASANSVTPGGAFCAVRGSNFDGHNFIDQAFARGALLAIVDNADSLAGRPGIVVANSRRALSRLAAIFAGEPSTKLKVIGITGTNGKTTTHWMVQHALNSLGIKCLRIGTLGIDAGSELSCSGSLTTPGPIELQQTLAKALTLGCVAVVMEASSHALEQQRVADVKFDVGVFSNLTRDHLDYHKTMDNYYAAKRILFEQILLAQNNLKACAINLDDEYGQKLELEFGNKLNSYSYGFNSKARIRIMEFSESGLGSKLTLDIDGQTANLSSNFIGRHNASNIASALGALLGLNIPLADAISALSSCAAVPGRLESVGNDKIGAYVDYAHTPDALERALVALRPITTGKLIAVFGCGGDRDKGKRPIMGEIASRLADRVIVTSDNPRSENPEQIIADIVAAKQAKFEIEVDRRKAIQNAISSANAGDVILIAGKGHEDYQIIGDKKLHFSDQEIVREYLG